MALSTCTTCVCMYVYIYLYTQSTDRYEHWEDCKHVVYHLFLFEVVFVLYTYMYMGCSIRRVPTILLYLFQNMLVPWDVVKPPGPMVKLVMMMGNY